MSVIREAFPNSLERWNSVELQWKPAILNNDFSMFKNFHLSKPTIFNLFLVAIVVYIFLATLPVIHGIKIGLDPSWTFAISQAHDHNLLFGRDIIFTYGPLGYLTQGAAITTNIERIFLFRFAVHFVFLVSVIIRVFTLQKYVSKIIFISSIALILFLGDIYWGTIGATTDYQIFFIFSIVLSFDKMIGRYLRSIAIAFGILAGFAMLSKLTLGIYIAGTFYLFILGNLIQSYTREEERKLETYFTYLQAFLNFTLTSLSIAVIFLYTPTAQAVSAKILVNLMIALAVYIALNIIFRKARMETPVTRVFSALIFYILYTIFWIQTITLEKVPSLLDYIRNSLQISSGYSSAMSVVGFPVELFLAFFNIASVVFLLYFLGKSQNLGLAIAFIFPVFLAFKHGYVRQDGHVLVFAITMIIIASICLVKMKSDLAKIKNISPIKISYILYILIFLSCTVIGHRSVRDISRIQQFSPDNVFRNVNVIFSLIAWNQFADRSRQRTLDEIDALSQSVKLPETVLEKVRGKTIDIIPWEFSIVPANGLNWQPRPIPQSYSAYTEKLDEINYQSLSRSPRDFIFYHFKAIDDRHPFFDEPKAFSYVFCNYKPDSIDRLFKTERRKLPYFLLDRQKASRCVADGTGETTSIEWNTLYELPTRDNTITRARIEFQYSLLGKILKTLFRIPPVFIEVNYLDGKSEKFRIVQDNSANGPIVSHLPRNEEEITSFLRGKLPPNVKSFRFSVSNPGLFAPEIRVTPFWETYR